MLLALSKKISAGACLLLIALFAANPAGANDDAEAIRKILRENPDIVMEILKENSRQVFEIGKMGEYQLYRDRVHAQWDADAQNPKKPDIKDRPIFGNPKAPVTIVTYTDYLCPHCRIAEVTLEELAEKYKNDVRIIAKAIPDTRNNLAVAVAKYGIAAFMQDQDKAWKFHSLLFKNARDIQQNGDNAVKALAQQCGLDIKKLSADAASPKVQAQLDADDAEATEFEISGTPHFLVNNLLVRGAVSKEIFEEAIIRALELSKQKK